MEARDRARRGATWVAGVPLILAFLGGLGLAGASHGTTTRVSVSSDGAEADEASMSPSLSADGRYVAFRSLASNLAPGDTNAIYDIFVRDLQTGTVERVSVSSQGDQANAGASGAGGAFFPSISADGRYVTFASTATNLVDGDVGDDTLDVFIRDRVAGTTEKISISTERRVANGHSHYSDVSADGRYVVFDSEASNLVPLDANRLPDVFVRDRVEGTTVRVSVAFDGEEANERSIRPSISSDGRYLIHQSEASNLVPGDTNGFQDVFIHELATGSVVRLSVTAEGRQIQDLSTAQPGSLSADGRYAVFLTPGVRITPGRSGGVHNVYLRDRDADGDGVFDEPGATTTVFVSAPPGGEAPDGASREAAVSPDGAWVAFSSTASNLTGREDLNRTYDVFRYSVATGSIEFASVSTGNQPGPLGQGSFEPAVSLGGLVAFHSWASTLVPDDGNGAPDVFVRDFAAPLPTCEDGGYEEGRVSGFVHERLEPQAGPLSEPAHDVNCGYIVPAGL